MHSYGNAVRWREGGEGSAQDRIPPVLAALPLPAFALRQNAQSVGLALAEQAWTRRNVVNLVQLRFEYFLDAGGLFHDYYGELFDVSENRLDDLFNDPSYKWLSEFPRRCKAGPLLKSPSMIVQQRLQILELGLRTPPLGFAI